MSEFAKLCLAALAAVTAENVLFAGGVGFSRVLRAARRPGLMGLYSLFVGLFSLFTLLLAGAAGPILAANSTILFLRPAIYAACAALIYLAVAFLCRFLLPKLYQKIAPVLAPAAVNCIVLAMPYVQRRFGYTGWEAVGFALGTGIAFYLASLVLAEAQARCKKGCVPRAFRNLPATLLYVGILGMVFAAFTGGKLF